MSRALILTAMIAAIGLGIAYRTTAGPRPATASETLAADAPNPRGPAEVYAAFRSALVAKSWRQEYECYTSERQAWFSYAIVGTALHLEFHTDLMLRTENVLRRHGIDLAHVPAEWRPALFRRDYDSGLAAWRSHVFPNLRDAPGLIEELQPLIREGYGRRPNFSRIGMTLETLDGYAFGFIRELALDEKNQSATAKIRVKTLRGAFVLPDSLAECAGDPESDGDKTAGAGADGNRRNADGQIDGASRVILTDAARDLYQWLFTIAAQVQALQAKLKHDQLVYIRLPTGDVAAGPADADLDDELCADETAEEEGLANNGTRTVTGGEVKFRRVGDKWLIDSVDYR